MRMLLVEDDAAIAEFVHQSLANQHYLVDLAMDGQAGWELAETFAYDLILLNLMLPYLDGIGFCQQLRSEVNSLTQELNRYTPVLLITAQSNTAEKVAALDAGADDYLVKPFDLDELLARVRALLRRGRTSRLPLLRWGSVQLDPSNSEVTIAGQPVHLSAKEYSLLKLFLRNPKRIFSHDYLIEQIWALEEIPTENAIRAQIKGLRKKLKEAGEPRMIETIYGLGYRLREDRGSHRRGWGQSQWLLASRLEADSKARMSTHVPFEKYREHYYQRFQIIEQAAVELRQHNLSAELRQKAYWEAHTLKGSLGLFELDEAFQLAGAIEQILQDTAIAEQVESLEQQVAALKQLLTTGYRSETRRTPDLLSQQKLASPTTPGKTSSQTTKILIIDDDPVVLEMLQPILQHWGFDLTLLQTPKQWWTALEQLQPELVILDIEMPEMNGIEICQAIRRDENWSALPILFLSAHGDDTTLQKVFGAGADDYVSKPVRAVELITRVLRRLEQARLLKQLRNRRPL